MELTAARVSLRDCIESALTPWEWAQQPDAQVLPPDDEARRLLERWERHFREPAAFERRLATWGLDRDSALRWLAPRRLGAGAAPLPAWADVLHEIGAAGHDCGAPARLDAWSAAERRAYELDDGRIPVFPHWLHPFVAIALRRLEPGALAALVPGGEALGFVARAFLFRLSQLAARALAAEIARRDSEAPPDHEERLDWLGRHPALARLLAQCTLRCASAFSEMLLRARADRALIGRELAGGDDPGPVAALVAWRSDAHEGGRTAAFVRFASGLEAVYKPRPHEIDIAFARFATELAAAGGPTMRLPRTLARGPYGWSEHIDAGDCADGAAVDRFRERQGALAAMVHFLCGMDFHHENFIPCGEYPVPIDLEALFSLGRFIHEDPRARRLPGYLLEASTSSIMASSMSSYWRTGRDDQALFVASGIAGCGERLWPQKQPVWEGTPARPRLDWRVLRYEYRDNLPRLGGAAQGLDAPGVERVVHGFRAAYRVILRLREALLAPDGALERFRGCRTRVVLRDTSEYAAMLLWSLAPAHLASGRAYAVSMGTLSGEVAMYGDLAEADVLSEDLRCCVDHDIPAWHSAPESTLLVAPSGRRFGPVLPESALAQAVERLRAADEDDCEYQAQLLRASLLAPIVTEPQAPLPAAAAPSPWELLGGWNPLAPASAAPAPRAAVDAQAQREQALTFAREIGATLAELALRLPAGSAWLGLSRVAGNAHQIAPAVAPPWSAAGAAGTAVLFANLHHAFGDPLHGQLARSALALCERAQHVLVGGGLWTQVPLSAYSGAAFPVYAYAECARLLQDDMLAARALGFALRLDPDRIAAYDNPDWLEGAAGVAAALLHLHRLHPDERLVERALAALRAIARASGATRGAAGFKVPAFERPLLGMAHGAAGIAAGCARIHAATGNALALEMAHNALAFESREFDGEARDWPDLRRDPGESRFMSGWCAGPAGAGMARMEVRDALGGAARDAEIGQAIANTRERMGIDRHHACCGEAGRILFLAQAARRLHRCGLASEALQAACATATFYRDRGYLRFQEFSDRAWTPGLLDGAGGVALAVLAAARGGCSNPLSLGSFDPAEES
jgi:type 2 lantibiotic biosynthesis protein LanM